MEYYKFTNLEKDAEKIVLKESGDKEMKIFTFALVVLVSTLMCLLCGL